ncbi:MAG: hypothetical protein AAFQ89_01610 [Cyanobacteria bacterium J06626_18]
MSVEKTTTQLLEEALQEQIAEGCPGAVIEITAPSFDFSFASA